MTRQPDVPSETPQGNAAVRPGLAQLPSALSRGSAVPAGTRPGRPLHPGSAASGPAGGRERCQGSARTLFPAPSRQAPPGSSAARDTASRRCPRGETPAPPHAAAAAFPRGQRGGGGGWGGGGVPPASSSPTHDRQPHYPRRAAHTAAPPERRPRSRQPYRACSAAAAILVGPGVIQRERRRRSSLGPARRWRRVRARCGDGQHRGAEDQAGVQGGAEERGGQSRSRRAPPPPSPAARWECGSGGRSGRPPARGGPRCPSAPPPRATGGMVPRPRGGERRFPRRRDPPGRGERGRRRPSPAGAGGSGAGPPQAGWKAPVAGRAVRGGALPAGRVGPPPASCPAARPSRPADRAAVARRAGLMRAGRDGGGRGPRRLQHRLRLAPLLHKPGFLISCVFCR